VYICRQRECSPLQEIETKVMALCRYQLMEAMGGGYWGGSVTVGMCESGAILLCEHKSPAVRL
jgi:hypothetical protein